MDTAVDILLLVILGLVCLGGTLLTVIQLPGTWLIALAAAGYAWYYGWSRIGGVTLGLTVGLAAAAELGELLSGLALARRGGASRRASWYGLVGGVVGALALTVPVPLIGTIVGAAMGCFVGAFLAEVQLGRGLEVGTRSGAFSAIGRALGSALKVGAGVMMTGLVMVSATMSLWR